MCVCVGWYLLFLLGQQLAKKKTTRKPTSYNKRMVIALQEASAETDDTLELVLCCDVRRREC